MSSPSAPRMPPRPAGALRQAGLEVTGPRPLERPIEEQLAKFEIVDFVTPALPEAHFFAIRHGTPDLLWKPALLTHPNGVVSLDALTIAVADPAEFAGRLGRFLSVTPVAEDGLLLKLAPGRVRIVDGAWLAVHLPGKTPALPYIAGIGLGRRRPRQDRRPADEERHPLPPRERRPSRRPHRRLRCLPGVPTSARAEGTLSHPRHSRESGNPGQP